MAEFDVFEPILQIADTGIILIFALHEFGSNVVGAREQTEEITDEVSTYCMTLKELAARLKEDEHILSPQGVTLAGQLQDKSKKIFEKIAALLPGQNKPDRMTRVQRVKWNFKKKKVEWLLAQLSELKFSLLVLIQILHTGRVIKVARYVIRTCRRIESIADILQRRWRYVCGNSKSNRPPKSPSWYVGRSTPSVPGATSGNGGCRGKRGEVCYRGLTM